MKYLFLVLLLILAATVQAQRKQYKIENSLACGIVFRVETDTFNRQRLLISSLGDQSAGIAWNNGQFVTTRATKDMLFDKANADRVFEVQGNGNYAASLCRNFSFNDSTCLIRDTLWYLPSVAELKLMYQVLDSAGKITFLQKKVTGALWNMQIQKQTV